MIIGPKYKICKRLGGAVFEKCQTQKFALSEARSSQGNRGRRRGRGMSDYKRQLLEKQKMRFTYCLTEKQLVRYVKEAVSGQSESTMALMKRLESRLDNVIYRLGLVKTRRFARQIVSHGHIVVNDKKMTIPSYKVREGDAITIRDGSKEKGPFIVLKEEYEPAGTPAWLRFDLKTLTGEMISEPIYNPAESLFDPSQVLQFYSR